MKFWLNGKLLITYCMVQPEHTPPHWILWWVRDSNSGERTFAQQKHSIARTISCRPQTGLHLHTPHENGVLSLLHFMFVKPFSEHQYLLHTCGRRVILSRMVVAACGSIGEIAIAQGSLCFHLGCTCTMNTAPRRCPCLVSASSGGQWPTLWPAVAWTPTWLPCCRELELLLVTTPMCMTACVAQLVRARDC